MSFSLLKKEIILEMSQEILTENGLPPTEKIAMGRGSRRRKEGSSGVYEGAWNY